MKFFQILREIDLSRLSSEQLAGLAEKASGPQLVGLDNDSARGLSRLLDALGKALSTTAPAEDTGRGTPARVAPKPKACAHEEFEASVAVGRILDVGKFTAELRVKCRQCGEPFRFVGVPAGVSLDRATVSIDELELRVPIEPQGAPRLQTTYRVDVPAVPTKN
ncbi:MAG: hypothetical protein AB7P99_04845 [Vicinamibacterales bacterium]